MFRLSEKIKNIEDKAESFVSANKKRLPLYITVGMIGLYFYGMLLRFIGIGALNFKTGSSKQWFTLNPILNICTVLTPYGIMITVFIILMYCLFTKRGYQLLSGYKTVKDKERGSINHSISY